ncbi:MAG: xylulokinase [Candidatus Hadarchaeia archaeon]
MDKDLLLGIDIGTQSAKTVLFDTKGNIVREKQKEYELVCPEPGWAEQDPQKWWNVSAEKTREIVESLDDPEKIKAVGVCGQMHAPVPIDESGNLLYRSPLLWCDKRNKKQTREAEEKLDEERIMEITGNPITPAWSAMKLLWMKENTREAYEKAENFLMPKDFINFKLTGNAYTDPSDASGTILYDVKNEDWSKEVAEMLEIDLSKFPDIVPSHKKMGEVSSEASEKTGLAKGTPVVTGGADFMCTLLAGGVVSEGDAADIAGTASEVAFFSKEPLKNENVMNVRHVTEEGWVPFGIQEGGLLRWFRDEFGTKEMTEADERNISPYEVMIEEASDVEPGSKGLIITPFFLGQRPNYPEATGTVHGLTTAHGRAHFIRALMEGITYFMKEVLDIAEESGLEVESFVGLGGGAKNYLWRKIKADVYNKPILTLESYEGGALGAAMLAGVGIGKFDSPKSAADKIVSIKDREEPDPEAHREYMKFYRRYKTVNKYSNKITKEVESP